MRVTSISNKMLIPMVVCNHRYGAKATFSFQTDSRLVDSIYQAEYYGAKNGVRIGAFVTNLLGQDNSGIKDAEDMGIIKHDIYHCTDLWSNPDTGVVERIPDYYEDKWSSAGAKYFNVVVGATKNTRYPSHGQNLYDLSDGKFGYDLVNQVEGLSRQVELINIINKQQEWYKSVLGKESSTASYRVGDNRSWNLYLPSWIAIRNSVPSPTTPTIANADTFYGYSGDTILGYRQSSIPFRDYWINYPSSFRWWDCWNTSGFTKEQATTFYKRELRKAIDSGGWYRDFCHFHSAKSYGNIESLDEFLQIYNDTKLNDFVWSCSNGEAIEYMFLRSISNRVVASKSTDGILISVEVVDSFKESDTNGIPNRLKLGRLSVPLSVEVDLTNTELKGKNIVTSSGNIISLGNDRYIVEVPFNGSEMFQPIEITPTEEPNYKSKERPQIDIVGSTVLFNTTASLTVYDSMDNYRPVYRGGYSKKHFIGSYISNERYKIAYNTGVVVGIL